jgi:hypothetical protein
MGTTVTTNLGLIKPDVDEKIQEDLPTFAGWATQNGVNCDTIDGLFRKNTTAYSVSLTASSVNPTLGAGSISSGQYLRLFPRMVIGFFRINVGGAGFATGTGDYRINLPVAYDPVLKASDGGGRFQPVGKAIFRDASAVATSSVFTIVYNPIPDAMSFSLAQGDQFANTFPPAQNDCLSGFFMYPTAAA